MMVIWMARVRGPDLLPLTRDSRVTIRTACPEEGRQVGGALAGKGGIGPNRAAATRGPIVGFVIGVSSASLGTSLPL